MMTSEPQVKERGEHPLLELSRPKAVRVPSRKTTDELPPAEEATPQARSGGERRIVELPSREDQQREDQGGGDQHPDEDREDGDKPRRDSYEDTRFDP